MRIGLFFLTNLAIVFVASITLSLLGVESYFQRNGINLDLLSLLLFCFVFGMSGALLSLCLSKWTAKRITGAKVIQQPANRAEQLLCQMVAQTARKAGIATPEIAIIPVQQANAFATGRSRNSALIGVSEGVLNRFNQDEIRAIVAHEIGHIVNGDMVTLALLQGVLNTFVMFMARLIGHYVDRMVFKSEQGHGVGFYFVTFISEIILGVLAAAIVAWFSRRREFRADVVGARLGSYNGMISALARLRVESKLPNQLPDKVIVFGITSGSSKLAALFASHPSLDERINYLEQLQNR